MSTIRFPACCVLTVWGLLAGAALAAPPFDAPTVLPSEYSSPVVSSRPFMYPSTTIGPAAYLDDQAAEPAPATAVPQPAPLDGGSAGCDDPLCGTLCCGPTWYAYGGGLVFTRNDPKFGQLSYDDTDLVGQVLDTHTGLGYSDGGAEIRIGYYLNPCWALEFGYWGLYGDNREATVYGANLPGNLNSALDFSPLNIGADNVNDLYDAAAAHRVRRDYDANNFELNLIHGNAAWYPNECWQVSYLAGIRYLRFSEDFQYASSDVAPVFGADLANEAYYDIDVDNDLWGFQLGGRADWRWTKCCSLFAGTKFGIYGNRVSQHSWIHNVNGTAVVGPGNPLAGDAFNIDSHKTVTSFVGELDLGLNFQLTPRLNAMLGYRAVAVSGVGYATDQIPTHFADLPGVADVDHTSNLILHGAYAGVGFVW